MNETELAHRTKLIMDALASWGITSEVRIAAIVRATSGIPWLIPEFRGNEDAGQPLFPSAVAHAVLSSTHGPPTPAHIMSAAIEIGGKSTSDQGHNTKRRWVARATRADVVLGVDPKLLALGEGNPLARTTETREVASESPEEIGRIIDMALKRDAS